MGAHEPRAGSPFHAGELALQERGGTREQSQRIAAGFFAELPPGAAAFVGGLDHLVLSLRGADGAPHATLLVGERGFLRARDARTLVAEGAELLGRARAGELDDDSDFGDFGAIGLDAPTRRRIRLTGRARREGEALVLHLDRTWSNCPKYISTEPFAPRRGVDVVRTTGGFEGDARMLIEQADVFYLATGHATAGLDASHRGGEPGFVRVLDEVTLEWDDFPGNGLYQSLGNLELDSRASLLFPDRTTGRALRLDGRARLEGGVVRFELTEA